MSALSQIPADSRAFEFQRVAGDLSKTEDLYSVDEELKERIHEFKALENKETAFKVLIGVLSILGLFTVSLSLFFIPLALKKLKVITDQKTTKINDVIEQIQKDTDRKQVIVLNAQTYSDPQSFKKALDDLKISDLKKYTLLQLAHQGIFALPMLMFSDVLINTANQYAPVIMNEQGRLTVGIHGDQEIPYLPLVSISGTAKDVKIVIEKDQINLMSYLRFSLAVSDPNFDVHRIFDFGFPFKIDLNENSVEAKCHLEAMLPL